MTNDGSPNTGLTLPAVTGAENGLQAYLAQIKRYPMLEPEEETKLARQWREQGDTDAAHILVTSHLRLVAASAARYRGYNLPISEIIAEGNIGLMQAVKRFDPDKGVRLSTYALWWIRAAIQDYILRSWSLVKIASGRAQKKLFFNLQRAKRDIKAYESGELRPEHSKAIAQALAVPEKDVLDMNRRLHGGDASLNAPLSQEDEDGEWIEKLPAQAESQEIIIGERQEAALRREWLIKALGSLNEREKIIFSERRLKENPVTLDELAEQFEISRERVRQIESRAYEKIRDFITAQAVATDNAPNKKALPAPPTRGRIARAEKHTPPATIVTRP